MNLDYIKLYVTLRDDPKVIGLSDRAYRAYVNTLLWCGEHETDGNIAPGLLGARVLRELEVAALVDEGLTIHNWPKFQKSHAALEATRQERRESGRRGGQAKGQATARANAKEPRSKNVAEVEVEEEVEQTNPLELSSDSVFQRFFAAFPTARKGARRPVSKAFERAIRRADPEVIVYGAERYRDDPNREDAFTVGAAAWLNRDGWEEPPLPSRNGHREESTAMRLQRLGIE